MDSSSTVVPVDGPGKGHPEPNRPEKFRATRRTLRTIEEPIITTTKTPVSVNGVIRWKDVETTTANESVYAEPKPVVLRQEIGEVLRSVRQRQGRTLREVSHSARVSLGYLSEVERGQKEASSEILASVAEALDVPISTIMREVGDRISVLEGIQVFPDVVPDDLVASVEPELSLR